MSGTSRDTELIVRQIEALIASGRDQEALELTEDVAYAYDDLISHFRLPRAISFGRTLSPPVGQGQLRNPTPVWNEARPPLQDLVRKAASEQLGVAPEAVETIPTSVRTQVIRQALQWFFGGLH